jgi:hypothetical protein
VVVTTRCRHRNQLRAAARPSFGAKNFPAELKPKRWRCVPMPAPQTRSGAALGGDFDLHLHLRLQQGGDGENADPGEISRRMLTRSAWFVLAGVSC